MEINGISGGAILIVAILFGLVGYAMGKPKGYPGVGFFLGLLLGCIGLVIVAIMRPAKRD